GCLNGAVFGVVDPRGAAGRRDGPYGTGGWNLSCLRRVLPSASRAVLLHCRTQARGLLSLHRHLFWLCVYLSDLSPCSVVENDRTTAAPLAVAGGHATRNRLQPHILRDLGEHAHVAAVN